MLSVSGFCYNVYVMKIFKLLSGMVAGGIIGFSAVLAAVLLFTDITLSQFVGKLKEIGVLELAGVMLLSILLFVVAMLVQVIAHEFGHLVCGLLSGYRFVSFRIGSVVVIRDRGKLRFKRFSIAGTGGQCLLTPPEKPVEEVPFILYNAGGVLANLLVALIAAMLCAGVEMNVHAETFCMYLVIVGVFLAITNGVPMKLGGMVNDARNIMSLRSNLLERRLFVNQLRVNAMVQQGMTPCGMPEYLFRPVEDVDYSSAIQVSSLIMRVSYLHECGDFEGAYTLLKQVSDHRQKIIGLLVKEAECELVYTALVTGRTNEARRLYTKELQTYVKAYSKVMSSKQRVLSAVAYFMDGDADAARKIYGYLTDNREKYLMQGEVNLDIALMARFLNL